MAGNSFRRSCSRLLRVCTLVAERRVLPSLAELGSLPRPAVPPLQPAVPLLPIQPLPGWLRQSAVEPRPPVAELLQLAVAVPQR
jgi:hypothetical protein